VVCVAHPAADLVVEVVDAGDVARVGAHPCRGLDPRRAWSEERCDGPRVSTLCSLSHRTLHSQVGAASAKDIGERGFDLFVGRVSEVLQQCDGSHDLPWLAVTALSYLLVEPRGLHRVTAIIAEPFDRGHVGAVYRARRHDARPTQSAVAARCMRRTRRCPRSTLCRSQDIPQDPQQRACPTRRPRSVVDHLRLKRVRPRRPPDDYVTLAELSTDASAQSRANRMTKVLARRRACPSCNWGPIRAERSSERRARPDTVAAQHTKRRGDV